MDKYYYLIAQLPQISFDTGSLFSIRSFLEEAEKWMAARDYRLLRRLRFTEADHQIKGPHVWQEFRKYETVFRRELAVWREWRKQGQEYKSLVIPTAFLKEENPLEAEKKLLELRWQFLDDLEKDHHFDLSFLVIYFIKLQILERLSVFNKEEGKNRFLQATEAPDISLPVEENGEAAGQGDA